LVRPAKDDDPNLPLENEERLALALLKRELENAEVLRPVLPNRELEKAPLLKPRFAEKLEPVDLEELRPERLSIPESA
jgi:hypothetical protein